jgi:hypothetical protein
LVKLPPMAGNAAAVRAVPAAFLMKLRLEDLLFIFEGLTKSKL